jgi:uracil-DNA glycosylase
MRMTKEEAFTHIQKLYEKVMIFVNSELAAGKSVFPPTDQILTSFSYLEALEEAKVVIIGQDPYIKPGQAHGLAFSVNHGIDTPPSLQNIYKELHSDLEIPIPDHGCLESWASQGVLLLNRVLTVEAGKPKSHSNKGWENFTSAVVKFISDYGSGSVFLLWGKDAQQVIKYVDRGKHAVLTAPHPSPLSAHRGFFGCKHFSEANKVLESKGLQPINWSV